MVVCISEIMADFNRVAECGQRLSGGLVQCVVQTAFAETEGLSAVDHQTVLVILSSHKI